MIQALKQASKHDTKRSSWDSRKEKEKQSGEKKERTTLRWGSQQNWKKKANIYRWGRRQKMTTGPVPDWTVAKRWYEELDIKQTRNNQNSDQPLGKTRQKQKEVSRKWKSQERFELNTLPSNGFRTAGNEPDIAVAEEGSDWEREARPRRGCMDRAPPDPRGEFNKEATNNINRRSSRRIWSKMKSKNEATKTRRKQKHTKQLIEWEEVDGRCDKSCVALFIAEKPIGKHNKENSKEKAGKRWKDKARQTWRACTNNWRCSWGRCTLR